MQQLSPVRPTDQRFGYTSAINYSMARPKSWACVINDPLDSKHADHAGQTWGHRALMEPLGMCYFSTLPSRSKPGLGVVPTGMFTRTRKPETHTQLPVSPIHSFSMPRLPLMMRMRDITTRTC
jgi:hypothetical protein